MDERHSSSSLSPRHRFLYSLFGTLVVIVLIQYAVIAADADRLGQAFDHREARIERVDVERRSIVSADGVVLASSVGNASARPRNRRVLAHGRRFDERTAAAFAHVVGYDTPLSGGMGVEQAWRDDLEVGPLSTKPVELTMRADLQLAAARAVGDREGAVVLVRPSTGEVLVSYGSPTFDPRPFGSQKVNDQIGASLQLQNTKNRPDLDRATQETFPPGSTFKLVTAAAALEKGLIDRSTQFPAESEFDGIRNASRGACGGSFDEALAESCNTVFARLGTEVGAPTMRKYSEAFGFDDARTSTAASLEGLPVAQSVAPFATGLTEKQVALLSIGQETNRATPLQMAMVAATIANDGRRPTPVLRPGGGDSIEVVSPETADTIADAMAATVAAGTARDLRVEGLRVAAKTGTAQVDERVDGLTDAWVVGFAGKDLDNPEVAFAVLIAHGSDRLGQTGASAAVPVAQAVLNAFEAEK